MKHISVPVVISLLLVSPILAADYLRDVKPLLEHKCFACHGAIKQQAGLRLDTAAALKRGGDSGETLTPGKPDESLLIGVMTGEAGFRMPPENDGSPLTEKEIELVRQWIADGAVAPANEQSQADPKLWWSYRPIVRPNIPDVAERSVDRTTRA